jgi:hypothetical protein
MVDSKEFLRNLPRASIDAEFSAEGLEASLDDVWSLQFYGEGIEVYCDTAERARAVLRELAEKRYIVYGWNLLCDVGAAQTWMHQFCPDGDKPPSKCERWKIHTMGNQLRASFRIARVRGHDLLVRFVDLRQIGSAMGMGQLAKAGEHIGVPKMPHESKCAELVSSGRCPNGEFPCKNDPVRWHCPYYAMNDAEVTYKFGEYFRRRFGIDPAISGTGGQIAQHYFPLPRRNGYDAKYKVILIPKVERQIALASYAGRSEVFRNGYVPETWINDVTSLYPFSVLQAKSFQVIGVELCDEDDIELTDKIGPDGWGWICGTVDVPKSDWGLPLNFEDRNFYVYGTQLGGLPYNSMDLVAAHAEINQVAYCLRPIFGSSPIEDRYRDTYLRRLSGTLPKEEKGLFKLALNASPGRLGQVKPRLARHTNFPAYSSMLGCSHLIMRTMMDRYVESGGVLHAMDTDSLIGSRRFEVSENINGLPFHMGPTTLTSEVLGKEVEIVGEGYFFRPKRYLIHTAQNEFKYALMGWRYGRKSYESLWSLPESLETTKEIKRTMNTQEKAALLFRLGGWSLEPTTLTKTDLHRLLSADHKRGRPEYDSLTLCEEKRSCDSWPLDWTRATGLSMDNLLTEKVFVDYSTLREAKSRSWFLKVPEA